MTGFFYRRNHDRLRTLLSSYIDGEVSAAESAKVEEHLAGCEDCRVEIESLRSTVSVFRSLPELAIPRSFVLAEAPRPVRSAPRMVWATRLATSAAALVLFALVLGDAFGFVTQSAPVNMQASEFAAPASESAASAPAAAAPAAPQAPAPAQPMPAAPAPTSMPLPGLPGNPEGPPSGPQGEPEPPAQSAPMAAMRAETQAMSQDSAAAEPTPAPAATQENLSVPESAPAPVMGMAAAVPTGTPVEGETSADADMPFARSGVEEIEKGQESSADAVSPNLARDETSSPEVSAGFQQATPDPLLPEEPSVAYSTSPFSLQDNVGNALRSASGSGEDSGTQETPGAAASDDGSLTVSNESQGLALPLRQLEIAFGITLVVLVVASLLIARNNGLWPFRR